MGGMYTRLNPMGVNFDVDAIEVNGAAYQGVTNMVPRIGKMVRAKGYSEIWPTPLYPPYYLQYTPQLSNPFWIYCGTSGIATIDATGAHVDRTPAELTEPVGPNEWTGGNLNGIAVINAQENDPFYWFDGQATAEVLPGLRPNTRYRVMRPFKYHLIGLNYTDGVGNYDDALQWSDAADPGQLPATWLPADDNEAGDNILADENGAIIDGQALRDSFFIYKQNSVYEMLYTGGNEVFRFVKVFGTTGLLTRNCIARVKGTHVLLGNGDIYQHDGQNVKSIIDGKLRRAFFATIDQQNYQASFVVYLEQDEEVWFCVPTTGNTRPNLALVWNAITGDFGYRAIPEADFAAAGVVGAQEEEEIWEGDDQAWDDDTSTWLQQTLSATEDSIVLADSLANTLNLASDSNQANGEPYSSGVSVWGLDLGDPSHLKAVRRLWPRVNAPMDTVFTVTMYAQDSPIAPKRLVQTFSYSPTDSGVAVDCNGRFVGWDFETDAQVEWDIAGFDVEYLTRGLF